MYVYYNPNPTGRTKVGDCSVRAIAKALSISWDDAFDLLCTAGKRMGDMPSSNEVIGAVLRQSGFHRENLPNFCPDCYSIRNFARDNPVGTYVVGTGTHIVCIEFGDWYDTWNCEDEVPIYFWVK